MERPILFSGEMVRAILAGRKTQTRRVIKPQPIGNFIGWAVDSTSRSIKPGDALFSQADPLAYRRCPYGRPDDTLWVRETWLELEKSHWCDTRKPKSWFDDCYRRVNAIAYRAGITQDGEDTRQAYGYKWRPSIYMPRWASRLTLRVVNLRVERVQEIDDAGAIAEGIRVTESADFTGLTTGQPVKDFMMLWDSINAKRGYSWDSNPWVWVVEFEVVTA